MVNTKNAVLSTAWTFTAGIGVAYIVAASRFLSEDFICVHCSANVRTFNDILSASCILTMILVSLFSIISCAYIATRHTYLEAVCVGSSYNLSITMLILSFMLHTAYTRIIWIGHQRTKETYRATYLIGYALSGIYALWLILIFASRKTATRQVGNPFSSNV